MVIGHRRLAAYLQQDSLEIFEQEIRIGTTVRSAEIRWQSAKVPPVLIQGKFPIIYAESREHNDSSHASNFNTKLM